MGTSIARALACVRPLRSCRKAEPRDAFKLGRLKKTLGGQMLVRNNKGPNMASQCWVFWSGVFMAVDSIQDVYHAEVNSSPKQARVWKR